MVDSYSLKPRARYGLFSIVALACAFGGIYASATGHHGWGLVLAGLSLPAGLLGLLRSISPEVRGGPLSIMSMLVGVAGVIFAIVAMVFKVVLL